MLGTIQKTRSFGVLYDQLFGALRKHSKELHVFTSNYDRAIEEYCSKEERKCRCIYGFYFDQFSKRRRWDGKFLYPIEEGFTNVYLCKLHGSLTWKKHKACGIVETGEERRSSDANYLKNLLVYPTLSPKDGQEIEPYSTMREEFKSFMVVSDVCVVIGFSFRDEHLNAIFSDFYKRGKSIIVVSPSADKNVFGNLLRKEIPEVEGRVPHKDNSSIIALYRENKRMITLNYETDEKNIGDISSLVSAALSNLAADKTW